MKEKKTDYNVFLSYAVDAESTAQVFKRALAEAGLRTYDVRAAATPGESLIDSARRALRESDAFVAVVGPVTIESSSMAIELGAAMALDKPIFVLLSSSGSTALPTYMQRFQHIPASQADKLVATLLKEARPLSEPDREALRAAYARTAIPTDKLFFDPEGLDHLTTEFRRKSHGRVRSERLLRELVRMRKRGKLPRLRLAKAGIVGRRQIA